MRQVFEVMNRHPVTIHENDNLTQIERLMREHRVRHLPVVRGDKLVGLVTHRDFIKAYEHCRTSDEQPWASDFMQTDLITATAEMSLEEAVHTVVEKKIGCLPIVQGDQLMGLVTETDLLRFCDQAIQDMDRRAAAEEYEADA